MRIVIVTPYLGEAYGTERVLADSCRLLRQDGHSVSFVTDVIKGTVPANDGLKIATGLSQIRLFATKANTRPMVDEALQFIEKMAADVVVFAEAFHPHIADPIIARWPTVYTAHSVAPTCPSSIRVWDGQTLCRKKSGWSCLAHDLRHSCLPFPDLARKTYAVASYLKKIKSLQRVNRVIAVSRTLKQFLVDDGWDETTIDVAYNPIELAPALTRNPEARSAHLVTTSRLIPMKGIAVLIDALVLLKSSEWTLSIVGEGPEESSLRQQVAACGLSERVKFVGKKSYLETQQIVGAATMLLQPNVGPEAFGIGMAESLALGVPVIATDLPSLNEIIIHQKTGLIVPPANAKALAHAISRLLADKALRHRLGTNGRADVEERFNPKSHLTNLAASLRAAIAARPKTVR